MYNSNHISMGFWLCKCLQCRGTHWSRRKIRKSEYRRIIKRLRRAKHNSELPNNTFDTMHYTD